MAVIVTLDEMLRKSGMTSKELCDLVDITEVNMSILRSGRAKAIRFSTLNRICYYLNCKPCDILDFDGKLEDKLEKRKK